MNYQAQRWIPAFAMGWALLSSAPAAGQAAGGLAPSRSQELVRTTHTVQPGQTIQQVLNARTTRPFDTVIVPAGVYAENVVIRKPGLRLVGEDATINGQFIEAGRVAEDYLPCIRVEASQVQISGFTFLNGGFGVLGLIEEAPYDNDFPSGRPVHGLQVSDCTFEACAYAGIYLRGNNARLQNNQIASIFSGGGINVRATRATSQTQINNNLFFRTDDECINCQEGSYELLNNQAQNCDSDMIELRWNGQVGAPTQTTRVESNTAVHCDGDLIFISCRADGVQALLENNHLEGGYRGIEVRNEGTGNSFTVRNNHVERTHSDGISLEGPDFLVENNTLIDCVSQGIVIHGSHSTITGNSVTGSLGSGIGAVPDSGNDLSTDTSFVITGNTCTNCSEDGIVVVGSHNQIRDNISSNNSGDGIDVDLPDGWAGTSTGNEITGNTCLNNNHEGIDNGGAGSVVDNNTCQGNGGGLAPDIAGTGENGLGSVASFLGNTMTTGGPSTAAKLDIPNDHTP